ncbi:hypothetical protein F183_A11140 [Bryobacterales bacterium F-183]|nr:hypothetical protein F183_A11140 [Bryobacterales bacterium F-183]
MIRLATFNVENLFDRPKIINLEDTAKSASLLQAAAQLQAELAKTVYDKPRIEQLLTELKDYVTVRADRGKFFKTNSTTKLKANGKDDWAGGIEFLREKFKEPQRVNTAQVIKNVDADVMCLIEVEGRQALSDFMREYIPNTSKRLMRNMLIDSPIDPRGIDIAVAWRKAGLGTIRSNAYDSRRVNNRNVSVWSRDCLEVELSLKDNKSLWILANHFKSKAGGATAASDDKRLAQGQRLAEILTTRYDLTQDLVAVMGDLNDTPDSPAIAPLYAVPNLHDVFDAAGTDPTDRYTYYFGGAPVAKRRTQIDYIFVSEPLKDAIQSVSVYRKGMTAVAKGLIPEETPFAGITGAKDAASDHAAIVVNFAGLDLPD